jgi:xylan 1,4-beta-xylosidase
LTGTGAPDSIGGMSRDIEIRNPILPGFHPDPCLCRDGDHHYIATSTFEWFPGVAIYRSRDLARWRLAARPLDRVAQLDLRGDPDSGGVWAPCLTKAHGCFWLVYTDTKTGRRPSYYNDFLNYVVSAPKIEGPWSDPVPLGGAGFDPSFFHDHDGRTWLVRMRREFLPGRNRFDGIWLQEYDRAAQRLVGELRQLTAGTELGSTEGPHLYHIGDWYYLILAEGGTGFGHAVTIMRARHLDGPFELDPVNPVLTARHDPEWPLQKVGHGSLMQAANGQWYMAFLCARPQAHDRDRRCMLGRETGLVQMTLTPDGWIRPAHGDPRPPLTLPAPALPREPAPPPPGFVTPAGLDPAWLSLRVPMTPDWCDASTPGRLRLRGRQSLGSWHEQSFVGRRLQDFNVALAVDLEFAPRDSHQAAGLCAFYDTRGWYYLRLTADDRGPRLGIAAMVESEYRELPGAVRPPAGRLRLRVSIAARGLRFAWAAAEGPWQDLGPDLDATELSDEAGGPGIWRFTGAFLGLCCQDLDTATAWATFTNVTWT